MISSDYYSFILAILGAGAAGMVGGFALMRRMTLAGDVMSHIALPGLGLALLLKFNPILGGAATLFIGTILIWQLQKKTGLATETTIGVIFAAAVAIGALVTPTADLIDALFGGFEKLTLLEFVAGLAAVILIGLFIWKYKNRLVLGLFSPELAMTAGVNLSKMNLYFLLIFSLTIIMGLQFLGAILVGALIIIPAAAARNLTYDLKKFLWVSAIISVVSVLLGFWISSKFGWGLGPAVVSVAAALYGLSLMGGKK
ncbi:MAG: metal ABC transporter permease [Candidatus Liptonbacteria bacterium]|nr:metal ABC transporter permease [Candidatus Liptonbacteria bacterium]